MRLVAILDRDAHVACRGRRTHLQHQVDVVLVGLFPEWPGETCPLYITRPSRRQAPETGELAIVGDAVVEFVDTGAA